MSTTGTPTQTLIERPRRADALRNYESVLAAAREAFAEGGESTSLEEIARRAGVGIGTLYRNFPNRQALLEALYAEEVEEVCRTAEQLLDAEPWEALAAWVDRFVAYMSTKRALVSELGDNLDPKAPLFMNCRGALFSSGEPLLARAQAAGVARPDVTIGELMQMIMGITKLPMGEPGQTERLVGIALDGLRYRP
jgi:AcrR family transcriptional regulator